MNVRNLVAMVMASSLVACDSESTPTPVGDTTGKLMVSIVGLPALTPAIVAVSGPQNYTAALDESELLEKLRPGQYQLNASAVTASNVSYSPTPPSQSVSVTAGTTASATISYAAPTTLNIGVQQVAEGLSSPVFLTAPGGDSRLFVVEQTGRIRIIKNGTVLPTPFLDITSRVTTGGERGLLSMAFDPQYVTNGRFYIYYTGSQGDIFVDRHTVSSNPDVANATFDRVIAIEHRMAGNHNGGLVAFGPDGMLYLGTGDGGGGGDPQNNGQNINALLGKLLRLDVSTLPYTSPASNPFVGKAGADEIWAYGLRNPWRFAFDGTGSAAQLYIADVGQNVWEEVNAVSATTPGLNFGWRIMEGAHCYNPSTGCNTSGLTQPVLEYNHDDGCSITGGFVYRGTSIPQLQGHYLYSDYCTSFLRSFRLSGGAAVERREWSIGNISNVLSFGVDGAGEMYMLTQNGRVYRIVAQ